MSSPTASSSNSSSREKKEESCGTCVSMLRQLVSGIQINTNQITKDSAPLTLLKAIANGNAGANGSNNNESTPNMQQQQQQQQKKLEIDEIPGGVRVKIPVTTTDPSLLRRYSALLRDGEEDEQDTFTPSLPSGITLATSSNPPPQTALSTNSSASDGNHLEIELKCRKCSTTGPEGGARAFLMGPQPLSIVLCQNRIDATNVDEVTEILTHELVHLYDVQTLKMDLQQCENLAYSEIRAAKAAECRNSWSQLQGFCVKQKAICATNNLFPIDGRRCVQKVFSKAFNDTRPFNK